MDAKRIIQFLKDVSVNNNRPWFQEHKDEYLEVKKNFEEDITRAISRIAEFDSSVKNIQVKDTTYRFYRDTRFSPDKSPYKNHIGAYVSAHGKKSMHGGYYIHLEPGHCLLSVGNYWLPTNILTACRNEIMSNEGKWLECVENDKFIKLFGKAENKGWNSPKGFGLEYLKTCPSGFPKDYEHIQYLRMKDYCCWKAVPDTFFDGEKWLDEMVGIYKVAKPMLDFMNNVIDDYE